MDWLIKPFLKCKKRFLNDYGRVSNIKIVKHNYLGHMLNKNFSLDINLNSQMLINQHVLNESINYVKKYGK